MVQISDTRSGPANLSGLEGSRVILVRPTRKSSEGTLNYSSEDGREGWVVGGTEQKRGVYLAGSRFRRGEVHAIIGNRIILYGGCD